MFPLELGIISDVRLLRREDFSHTQRNMSAVNQQTKDICFTVRPDSGKIIFARQPLKRLEKVIILKPYELVEHMFNLHYFPVNKLDTCDL